MFWRIFKNRRNVTPPPGWWIGLQARSHKYGERVSGWLQKRTANLSTRRLKITYVLMVLLFTCWNGWIILQSIRHPVGDFFPQQIRVPGHVQVPAKKSDALTRLPKLDGIIMRVDSLMVDSAGRRIYERALKERPGLLDSLRKLEKMYSQ
jgi:hypothetical protein